MSANIKTILVLGATSGLGEAFARRFHAQGKKAIAAGRRVERFEALKSELRGLEAFQVNQQRIFNLCSSRL
jgi:NADP-dependent 3-hydroxy acid dehydrogenase YdfG